MSQIILNSVDYDLEVYRVKPGMANKVNQDWKIWKYRFYISDAKVVSQKRYETFKGAKNAGERLLTEIIRSKIKDTSDHGMVAAESMFINEYYKVMNRCEPSKLFESHNTLLKKVIDAYIDEVDMRVF